MLRTNMTSRFSRAIIGFSLALWTGTVPGCGRKMYDPAWATRPYPDALHTTNVADMQVFRRGTSIEIVNATAHSYREVDLWLNQRYVCHVSEIPAGQSTTLSLWDFHDEFGDAFNAGGFFRSYEATPVRMVEIQTAPEQPMIGLVAIRAEEVRTPPSPNAR